MTWGFLWIMLALKLPLAALIYIVWWAIKQEPGRVDVVRRRRRHQAPASASAASRSRAVRGAARTAIPRPQPPARVRTVRAKARTFGH